MPGCRSVSIGILVDTGPLDEGELNAGLAHLVEHSLFLGTSSRTSGEIARMIDTMGGRIAAFTGRDYTCFTCVVMDDHRTYVLDLLSDLLLNSVFPEEQLEHEKSVILNESYLAKDNPHERADSLLRATMWPDHPLGRAIEGDSDSVTTLTREDVIYFLHAHYLPDRITIGVAGNLEHQDIVAQVRDCFWRLGGESTDYRRPSPPTFYSGFVSEPSSASQAYFSVGIKAPVYNFSNRYHIHLLNTILGGGLSSRLFRSLRNERGLVYDIHSEYLAYRDAGSIVISGNARPEMVFDIVDEVMSIVQKLTDGSEPCLEEELWQAKMYNIGQHHIDSEDPFTRMSRLLTQLYYFNQIISTEAVIRGIEEVTSESLATLCDELYMVEENLIAGAVVGGTG